MVDARGLHIVRMGDHHLEEVFSLIDRENWGWEFAEISAIHRLDPGSSLVAMDGREMVGLLTCIDYGSYAFIIHIIVRKGWRRKGVGVRIVQEALAALDSRGVRVVELHANPEAAQFYHQFSFKGLEDISFVVKEPSHRTTSRVGATAHTWLGPSDLPAVAQRISGATGCRADDALRAMMTLPPDHMLSAGPADRMTDLLISRSGASIHDTGPWIMEAPTGARAVEMMGEMISGMPAKRVDLLVPASSEPAAAALGSLGFTTARAGIVRMVRSDGPAARFPPSVLAVGHIGLI
jgi:predicted N-acetyltransferase YhbS